MGKKRWLFASDLEGTLALFTHNHKYPSVWPMLAEALGPECMKEENDLTDLWNAKRIQTYTEYMQRTIEIHKQYGLTQEVFERVLAGVPWITGIEETFKDIKEDGGMIAIVTGGFVNQAERVPGRTSVDFMRGACKYLFDQTGTLGSWDLFEYDWKGKVATIKDICDRHGLDITQDVVFVGDGKNDVHIAEAVGHSIAINAHPELRAKATVCVETSDFRAVLKYLPQD